MRSRLINVRLDEERVRKARKLRDHGIVLSELVREAIDSRFDALAKPGDVLNVDALIDRLFERYPDPPDLPPRTYDVKDASQARSAIRRRLSTPRR